MRYKLKHNSNQNESVYEDNVSAVQKAINKVWAK